jgi:hypothetical protein
MKAMKLGLVVMVTFLLITGIDAFAQTFHSGGVGECAGCHSMHSPKTGGTFLLVGTDQSSTCLICHQRSGDTGPTTFHISTDTADMPSGTPPKQRTPGGDFGWLKKAYSFLVDGNTINESGDSHGHNIVAVDFGYAAESNVPANRTTFPAAQLSCISCHDPHGQYRRLSTGAISLSGAPIIDSGSYDTSLVPSTGQAVGVYRLLAGNGYAKGGITFAGVPAALTPSSYNRTEASNQTRTAYGHATGGGHVAWGTWCSTCHPNMHSNGNYVHAVDETLGGTIKGIYDRYKKSGDLGGINSTAFTSLVPFVENTADYTVLASHAKSNDTYLNGPGDNDRVSCISCHRAHASGWENTLRWKMEGEFMVYNSLYPGTDTTPLVPQFHRGRTSAETQAAYYDRPVTVFASYQRILCNKCHAKD